MDTEMKQCLIMKRARRSRVCVAGIFLYLMDRCIYAIVTRREKDG